MDDKSIKIE